MATISVETIGFQMYIMLQSQGLKRGAQSDNKTEGVHVFDQSASIIRTLIYDNVLIFNMS